MQWLHQHEAAAAAGIPVSSLRARRQNGTIWTARDAAGQLVFWVDEHQRRRVEKGGFGTKNAHACIGPRPEGADPIPGRDDHGNRIAAPPTPAVSEPARVAPEPTPTPAPYRPTTVTKDDPDNCYYSEVDPRTRRVMCYAPHWKRPLTITFEQDGALHRAYSAEGSAMTVREVGDRFGWSPETVRSVLRSRGLTHASAMWPAWEIEERGEDDVLGDLHAQRIQRIRQAADRQRVAELQRAYERQTRLEDWTRELLTGYVPAAPRPPRYSLRDERPRVYVLDAMTDVHIEALAADGTGHDEKRDAVLDVTDRLIVSTLRAYHPERVGIIVGSDWLDADRYDGATTRGTPQHASLPRIDVARLAMGVLRERIQRWRAIAEVDLIIVPGNHDRELTAWLHSMCELAFGDAPDVRILSDRSGRVYVRHGSVLLGVTHGDTARAPTLPGIMAEEAPDQGGVRHRHWVIGHLHKYEVASRPGASVTTAPALAKPSPWALQNFGPGDRSAVALCYHAEAGHVATLIARPGM